MYVPEIDYILHSGKRCRHLATRKHMKNFNPTVPLKIVFYRGTGPSNIVLHEINPSISFHIKYTCARIKRCCVPTFRDVSCMCASPFVRVPFHARNHSVPRLWMEWTGWRSSKRQIVPHFLNRPTKWNILADAKTSQYFQHDLVIISFTSKIPRLENSVLSSGSLFH